MSFFCHKYLLINHQFRFKHFLMTDIRKTRIESIDLLKGLVMIIMALDHVRDYFHYSAFFFDPTDPIKTTLPIYFTRFITNFCAPAFSFLAGLSAFMVGKRKSKNELSQFLIKRGLWLIFAEIVILSFAWQFDSNFSLLGLQVIWVLGISMIFLAGLIHLPLNYLLVFSCVCIFGHNLLDTVHYDGSMLWSFIHEQQFFPNIANRTIVFAYPILPWFAVMSLGYYFGSFYDSSIEPQRRKKIFNIIGISAWILLLILRFTNIYGNLLPREDYGNFSQNLISFLNLTKYPPSLSFLLLTLGATLLFLANTEKLKGRIVDFFCVFGRVPFFYYIIHVYLIHLFALIAAQVTGFGWKTMILKTPVWFSPDLKGYGFSLPIVYLVWIGVIVILYPICKKFDRYKQGNKDKWWLSYL
jgi:uncharacterized membrane protein